MTKLHRLPTIALAALLLLPGGGAAAQDAAAASVPPETTVATDDARLDELAALVPPALAGLPLTENLQLATGEQLTGVMQPQELAVLGEMLEAEGKTVADYAAAAAYLPVSDTLTVTIQAHRVAGIDATRTIDAWVEILSLHVDDPQVSEGFIGGRPVTRMSDSDDETPPLLHMFPAGDVVWMMWTADEALVEVAMDEVGAAVTDSTEESTG